MNVSISSPMACAGRRQAIMAVLAAVVLWASAFPAMKSLLARMDPLAMIWSRMAIASLFLLPVMIRSWSRVQWRRGDGWWLLALVVFEPGLYFLFETQALQYTSAAQAGMIVALLPIMAATGGALFFREGLKLRILAGLFLSVIGVAGLTLAGDANVHAPSPWLGNTLEFLAMVCAVGYILIVKHLGKRHDIWFLTAVQMVGGFILFLPGAVILFTKDAAIFGNFIDLSLLVYLGLGVTVLAYGLYNTGISRLTAAQATVLLNLIPVLAVVMSWLTLGETLSLLQVLFAGVTLAGVALSQWQRRKGA